jgi:molybdopterin synthase catalytic subunit
MSITAIIVDGPVTPEVERAALGARGVDAGGLRRPGDAGAVVRFEGVVRRLEADQASGGERELAALDYQTYDPMAERELSALAGRVAERHGLLSLIVLHSRGRVAVGEVSFVLIVASAHRAEALAASNEFIDQLKRDVPIWKRAVWNPDVLPGT